MSEQPCATCHGTRLKPEALAVRLHTLSNIPVEAPHELHTMRVGLGEPASGSDEHSRVAGGDFVINHAIDSDPTPPEVEEEMPKNATAKSAKNTKSAKKNGNGNGNGKRPGPDSGEPKVRNISID